MGYHRRKIGKKWAENRRNFAQNRRFVLPGLGTNGLHQFQSIPSYFTLNLFWLWRKFDIEWNLWQCLTYNFSQAENYTQDNPHTCVLCRWNLKMTKMTKIQCLQLEGDPAGGTDQHCLERHSLLVGRRHHLQTRGLLKELQDAAVSCCKKNRFYTHT